MSEEKDHKALPAPAPGAAPIDPSELERTREVKPGSLGVSWPRPSPRSVGPVVRGPDKAAASAPSKAPAAGRGLFSDLPRPASSRPPEPPSRAPSLPRRPVDAAAAPPPGDPSWGVEELSGSLLLPDDGLSEPRMSPSHVEELSGSVLIEDGPDGGPPVVTRMVAAAPAPEPLAAPHRALLGMPELPKATPGPSLDPVRAQPQGDVSPPPEGPEVHRLDESSGAAVPPGGSLQEAPQPRTRHSVRPSAPPPSAAHGDDVEVTALPRGQLAILGDAARRAVEAVRAKLLALGVGSKRRRPAWFWPALVVPMLALGAGFTALLGSPATPEHKGGNAGAAGSAPGSPSSLAAPTPVASTTVARAVAPPAAASPPAARPCVLGGSPVAVAPAAIVGAGVEVRSFGEDFAIGFAPDDHAAVGIRLGAASLAAAATTKAHSKDPIRRVRPVATSKGALILAVDADRKGDRLSGRRTLPVDPPLQVGAHGSDLVWSHAGGPPAGTLWPLDGPGDVEALRGATEGAPGDTTTAIAFRSGSAIWVGAATGYKALAPKGALAHVDGLGPAVGSPAIAVNDGVAIAAWADRASANDAWGLRWVRFRAGEAPGEPRMFTPPGGGQSVQAMSPSLAAVPGGRFLLVWTEGPTSLHRVRAITLSGEGAPVGSPLEISSEGSNAGQGQGAVGAGGGGLVAFLESSDGAFRVVATPIACGD